MTKTIEQDEYGNQRTLYVYPGSRHGYYVRVPKPSGCLIRFFGATKHGGIDAAYQAALNWRDASLSVSQLAKVIRGQHGQDGVRGVPERQRYTLGRPGIRICQQGAQDGLHARATAHVRGVGNHFKSYATRRYGLKRAVRFAVRSRLAMERRYYDHRSHLTESDWVKWVLFCYEQFGREAFTLTDLKHPGSATRHDSGLQARITIRRQAYSSWFAYRRYANEHEAHVAAVLWCIRKQEKFNPSGSFRILKSTKRNTATGVAGVSRVVKDDRRGKPIVLYVAEVKNGAKRYPVGFSAGRVEAVTTADEKQALVDATACRKAWERAFDLGEPFSVARWRKQHAAAAFEVA